jgi:hypothetical protein
MPVPCVRAGLLYHLLCAMDMCHSRLCCVCVVVLCVFVLLFAYGPCLRAGQGIVVRLTISVVGSSRRGHNVERSSFSRVLAISI